MQLTPYPRFRLYGSPDNYLETLAAALTLRVRRHAADLAALEARVSAFTGAAHALCIPQARLGIYLALSELIRAGQKVILSPYTNYDVINMVVCAGGQPVFADVEPETCNIDAGQIADLIDSDTGAVIATHMHGLACEIETIAELCRQRNIALIEDAAQCFGGRVNGRHVGTYGDAGVFSFQRIKNVNAFSGGMLVTRTLELRERIANTLGAFPYENPFRVLARAAYAFVGDILTTPPIFQSLTFRFFRYDGLHGIGIVDKLLRVVDPALLLDLPESYKRRMTPLQARLARRQIDDVNRHSSLRLERAEMYHQALAGLPEVGLPPLRLDGSHVYLAYPIRVAQRSALVKHMLRQWRDIQVQNATNAAELGCFSAYARTCPNARTCAQQVLLLPTYPGYPRAEIERNIEAIRQFYRGAAG